jgi:hypothetical protein
MSLVRFREWLSKQDDQSIDFWGVVQRKRRNIRNIRDIRVQGTIYTALLFFFDHFDGSNVPFLESTVRKISQMNYSEYWEYCEYSEYSQYSHLVDEIAYGYDDNDISISLIDV